MELQEIKEMGVDEFHDWFMETYWEQYKIIDVSTVAEKEA